MSAPVYSAVTDAIILGYMQDALLEPNNNGASMYTNQITTQQMINALNQAQNDFQRDAGAVMCHVGAQGDTTNGIAVSAGAESVPLPQDCMDVRRRAWIAFTADATPVANAVLELPPQDSFALDNSEPTWENLAGTPGTADESTPALPSILISPQPSDVGQVDLLYTPVPTQLSNTGVPLSVPPDCAVPVFFRAMQLIFENQGEAADDQRARYWGGQYLLAVQLVKSLAWLPLMRASAGVMNG